jgi:RNA 3'-terminal phosphate cyclase
MGPVGFFAGTTQMTFDATITDASGKVSMQEQVKATVRGESESTNVAADVAKKLAKRYAAVLEKTGDIRTESATGLAGQ